MSDTIVQFPGIDYEHEKRLTSLENEMADMRIRFGVMQRDLDRLIGLMTSTQATLDRIARKVGA